MKIVIINIMLVIIIINVLGKNPEGVVWIKNHAIVGDLMNIPQSTLDKLYEKKTKLEIEKPLGYELLLYVINKQIDAFEKRKRDTIP